MRQLLSIQRQIQDLFAMVFNQRRVGKITEVKFDQEKKRWFAKFQSGKGDENETFKSDWRPWKSFSNGTIKISLPPRVGQIVALTALGGRPELGILEPYHNDPDNVSPHDKEDELFLRIEKPSKGSESGKTKDETLDLHFTKDGSKISIGSTQHGLTKDAQSIKTKNDSIDTETHTAKASKSHSVTTKEHAVKAQNRTVEAGTTTIKSGTYSLTGKTLINC
jgi:phage baseplate assembly protein gpV